jgi:hypothetical protein
VSVATGYGAGICLTTCKFAPYCGDHVTQTNFGEQCDGQSNCNAMCEIAAVR